MHSMHAPAGRAAVLKGLGAFLPPRAVGNEELALRLGTTDDWIRTRTGIRQRFWADPGTATSELAVEAGARALRSAGLDRVDAVILATSTPDHPIPGTAPAVAARLGLGVVAAFDVSAVCSGFVYALANGAGLIATGTARRVLVIGAETYSTILDPTDPSTSVIFGDGAGAVVLEAGDPAEPGALLGFDLGSDGRHEDLISMAAGGSRQRSARPGSEPADTWFTMRGRQVFAHAVTRMGESAATLLDRVGWSAASVDRFVGHQANVRILYALADGIGIDRDRVAVHLDRVGNTSAASIPLALADGCDAKTLRPGDRVLMTAFGGGLTWGSTALVWPDVPAA
ncbi:beta-ketoacyl-ACP synthase III [Streptomyces sp. NPDC048258]|uniref:beta-ketoacyl-ACP synthase III n=1 Tax=Streptomyces sp. NPDC048258 TaxID=3365527 RepID=UPI00372188D9